METKRGCAYEKARGVMDFQQSMSWGDVTDRHKGKAVHALLYITFREDRLAN